MEPLRARVFRCAIRLVAVTVAGCGVHRTADGPGETDGGAALAYLEDPAFARAELVASLVDPSDGYATLRLAHYATGAAGDWDRLAIWNPIAETIVPAELDQSGGARADTLSERAGPARSMRV
jgi:hypothetical protein